MRKQLEQRLEQLKADFDTGQRMLAELEAKAIKYRTSSRAGERVGLRSDSVLLCMSTASFTLDDWYPLDMDNTISILAIPRDKKIASSFPRSPQLMKT